MLRRSFWRFAAIAALCLANIAWSADDKPLAAWSASCHSAHGDFSVSFASASGDAYEDDMTVEVITPQKGLLRVPLPAAMFQPRGAPTNVKSLCDTIAAVDVGNDRALVL